MSKSLTLKIFHKSEIRRITVGGIADAEFLYDQCAKVCKLPKGKFIIKTHKGAVVVTEEDVKLLLTQNDGPIKVVVSEEVVPIETHYDHKYDTPSDSSMIDLASSATLATSLDSFHPSNSLEITSPPIDSSLSFAFVPKDPTVQTSSVLLPATVVTRADSPAESPVASFAFQPLAPSQSALTASPSIPPVLQQPLPLPDTSAKTLESIASELSELRQATKDHRGSEMHQVTEVCARLSSVVDTLQGSLQAFREQLRSELSQELTKHLTQELTRSMQAEFQKLTEGVVKAVTDDCRKTVTHCLRKEDDAKELDDSLVRLQASVTDPAQLEVLKKLESMGFTNHTFNSVLLETHQGDIEKVIADLRKFYKLA